MKNSLLLLFLCLCFLGFSQQNQLPNGEYSSVTPAAKSIKLVLSDNNRFTLSVLSGSYEKVNDSVYFHSDNDSNPKFTLHYSNPNPNSAKVKIVLDEDNNYNFYYYYKLFLGIPNVKTNETEFKSLKERSNINESYEVQKDVFFEIDRVPYIYLVEDNSGSESYVEKYEIPQSVSEIKLTYNNDEMSKLKLKGRFDEQTKQIVISEGKLPLTFSSDTTKNEDKEVVKPTENKPVKNWTFPGKPKEPDYYGMYADSTAVAVDTAYNYNETPKYIFKLKTEKTLAEALKIAKSFPNKFLVVFYDTGATVKEQFKNYIESYESTVQSYMYDKYYPEYDNFNFYLATEKDKNALKKLGVTQDQSVVFLNSDGTNLYHGKEILSDSNYSYYTLDSMLEELKGINAKAQLDNGISNKKAAISQIERPLQEIVKHGRSNYMNSEIPPPAPPVDSTSVPVVTNIDIDNVKYDTTAVAVDTVAAVVDFNFSSFRERNGIYKFKSSQDAVNEKWSKVLDSHAQDNEPNEAVVEVILSEFRNNGFNYVLFNAPEAVYIPNDFKEIKYILKFYKELKKKESEDSENYYDLNTALASALARNINKNYIPLSEYNTKALGFYREFLALTENDPKEYRGYIQALKDAEMQNEYLESYDTYFNSIANADSNLIEQLDKAYQNQKEDGISWNDFKYEFAYYANDAAWYIVEKVKESDSKIIKNGIKWSETSLKIEKENHYYLDTLAQLYYRNGEKEKAITFEEKAIEFGAKDPSFDRIDEYKTVLEKMKNGTY